MDFVGPMLASDVATAIAEGEMDPISMQRFPAPQAPLPRRSSIQSSFAKPTTRTHSSAAAFKPKAAAITSFFHASESAAAAVFNAPRSSSAPTKRSLPPSFLDSWASKGAPPKESTATSGLAAKPAVASPLLTSRFFGGSARKMSPPDEYVKKTAARSSSSTYQSQEPCGVDVARNISFDPLQDKIRVLPPAPRDHMSKENQAPNAQETVACAPPPVKETAFSRMMRAGSMLQQHKLKRRKTSGPGFRSGKLRVANQGPLSSRIGRFSFTGASRPTSSNAAATDQSTDAESVSESLDEPEAISSDDGTGSETTASALDEHVAIDANIVEDVEEPRSAAVSAAPTAPTASFDRFRFHH
jgi:hypothetical protein